MHRIQNYTALARTPARRDALDIIEAGLAAIDTATIVRSTITYRGSILTVGAHSWDLRTFRRVHAIGFGKASCAAAAELERILGDRLNHGIALGTEHRVCQTIDICEASHPLPSERNVELTERLVRQCEGVSSDDLVIVIVSGGGSAMLAWPMSEYAQGVRLYEAANRAGLTIEELNTVRKHISGLKGGGLAKLLYPATVIGIVFSDIPGDAPALVASGPTYPDHTTVADAQAIIDRHRLGSFDLRETPKEPRYFEHVTNIVLASNTVSLDAMAAHARTLGYTAQVIGNDFTGSAQELIHMMRQRSEPHSVVLVGGEARLVIASGGGIGGRNQHVALTAATMLADGQAFAAIASDGRDNGDTAGALVDDSTLERATSCGFSPDTMLQQFNEQPLLAGTGDLVFTGPTGSNVSDLYILLVP
ncbi:MAG: DUF4147 domain-containing protein [Candidatus Yanofskybacteria bacterium]|nr:DUF4147 domain-containing protein [Candidatus Yanofskybacteria bacterium]